MEEVISLGWGGLLRETEIVPEKKRRKSDRAELAAAAQEVADENSRRTFLQGLENALAVTPEPGMSLYEEAMTPSQRRLLEQLTSGTVGEQGSPSVEILRGEEKARREEAAALEAGSSYQPRLVWVGTSFEERQVLIPPPQMEMASAEEPPAPALEAMSVETVDQNTVVEAPGPLAMVEAATEAAEPQSEAVVEEAPVQALTTAVPHENLSMDERQPAPCMDAAVAVQAPSNGSKITSGSNGAGSARWFVLNGVLGGAHTPEQSPVEASNGRVPVLEVFSLAGGVGKTSLAATLGRALSVRGERVLLVEATPFGSLPYYFGARDCRPGVLRTFRPPASSTDAPIRLATLDSEWLLAVSAEQESITAKIQGWAQGVSRVIVDVATGSTAATRGLLPLAPTVLVPLVPDVNSVLAAHSIDSYLQHRANAQGLGTEVYYILNQFDPSLPLHLEVGKVLRGALGERLLPFVLERNPAVSEALADGMTVVDYAPGSSLAEDYTSLAKWVEQVMAQAQASSRGGRWSER
jgi:cellulose synthase operon protein YhjQ